MLKFVLMEQAPTPIQHAEDEISLIDLWSKLNDWWAYAWARKGWIIFWSLLLGIANIGLVYTTPPTYTATLTFALEEGESGGGSLSGLASQFGYNIGGSGGGVFAGGNLLELMKSRRLIQDVLLSPGASGESYINHYVRTKTGLHEAWSNEGLYPFPLLVSTRSQDSVIGGIVLTIQENALSVAKQDKDLSFVTLSYTGHDEDFVKGFTEALVEHTTSYYVRTKTAKSQENIDKLQRRTDSVTTELEIAMLTFAQASERDSYTSQLAAKVPTIQAQMKVTMLTTFYGELVKNLELSKTLAAREEPLIQIIDRPHYPLLVRESKAKAGVLGAILGGFLYLLFMGGREFIRDLSQQASQLK